MNAALAVARHQLRITRSDPAFLVIMFLMPLALMPLMREALGINLIAAGFEGADGAEQVVPGQMVLFGFFVAGGASFALFREHGYRTWDRIRSSAAHPASLLAGFAGPWVIIHVLYQVVLLGSGAAFFGLRLNGGSAIALLLVLIAFAYCSVAIVLLAASSLRTVNQVQAIVNVGAMVFGGLGGALVPFEQLPGWAQTVAPATPHYWVMQGHRRIFLEQATVGDVLVPVLVLIGIAVVASALGAIRFRADETKEFFA